MSVELCVYFGLSYYYMVLLTDSIYNFCASCKQYRNHYVLLYDWSCILYVLVDRFIFGNFVLLMDCMVFI